MYGAVTGSLVGAVVENTSEWKPCGWCGRSVKISKAARKKNDSPCCINCIPYQRRWERKRQRQQDDVA